jgi:undecaprenyl-diphosphatase
VLELIVLGIVQGLTEFLPVSSTAHLLFAEHYLGLRRPGLVLEGVLHIGTALAAAVICWPDVRRLLRSALGLARRRIVQASAEPRDADAPVVRAIVIATVVTVAIGLVFQAPFERLFSSVRATAVQLILTGCVLLLHQQIGRRTAADLGARDAALLGVAQAVAIVPGISRSGTTIVGALRLGMERVEATRLSFLMAIPVILGAGLYALKDAAQAAQLGYTPVQLVAGGVIAGVVGAISMRWLIGIVQRQRLIGFAVYCWVAGAAVLLTAR